MTDPHPLRGRTPASLARRIDAWHIALNRGRAHAARTWGRSRWGELVHHEWAARDSDATIEWRLFELIDAAQLADEGRAMRHCVSTYCWSCLAGRSAIFSLRRRVLHPGDDPTPARSILTIQVDPRTATIVQIRGFANKRAGGHPLELVRTWAARERLQWSPTA